MTPSEIGAPFLLLLASLVAVGAAAGLGRLRCLTFLAARPDEPPERTVERLADLAAHARTHGVESLSRQQAGGDPLLGLGLSMAATGAGPDLIRDALLTHVEGLEEQRRRRTKAVRLGTLLGAFLVLLLVPRAGTGFASAAIMLALCAGAVLHARWMVRAGDKEERELARHLRNLLVVEGMAGVASGQTPAALRSHLAGLADAPMHRCAARMAA